MYYRMYCHVHYKNNEDRYPKTAEEYGMPYNVKKSIRSCHLGPYERLRLLGKKERK